MSLVLNSTLLADAIIDHVRDRVVDAIRDDPDADPWNELDGGAAWLDNELTLAKDIFNVVQPRYRLEFPLTSVPDVRQTMIEMPPDQLLYYYVVIVTLGGSGNPDVSELADESVHHIRTVIRDATYRARRELGV